VACHQSNATLPHVMRGKIASLTTQALRTITLARITPLADSPAVVIDLGFELTSFFGLTDDHSTRLSWEE